MPSSTAESPSARTATAARKPRATAEQPNPFRLDIEGLRGLAIILVVLYHVGAPGFDGGFVGVDIFFVISGFLITGILIRELRSTGRIDVWGFLARRVRRLLPAAVLVVVVTFLLAKLAVAPLVLLDLRRDALSSLSYLSNYWFAYRSTDYLLDHSTASPFQQYWSLAVEEQFYLVWPALLVLCGVTLRKIGVTRACLVGIGGVLAASFALCVLLTGHLQPMAFFGLPTRAWELATGGLIALSVPRLRRWPSIRARAMACIGLGLLLIAPILVASAPRFPGWIAAVPVAGAAFVIAGGVLPGGPVRALLATRPLAWIGRLSYSIYLWHWPLLLLAGGIRDGDLPWPRRVGLIAATLVLAWLTHRLVENPLRRHRWFVAAPSRSLVSGAVATAAAAAVTLVVAVPPVLHTQVPAPAPSGDTRSPAWWTGYVPRNLTPPLRTAPAHLPDVFRDGCHSDFSQTHVADCIYGFPDSPTTLVLFGDSHAASWFPPIRRIAEQRRLRLISLTKSSCPSASVSTTSGHLRRAYRECDEWRERAFARIDREQPDMVLIANNTNNPSSDTRVADDVWWAGMATTLDRLATVPEVTVLADTPYAKSDVPACLSGHLTDALACALPRDSTINAVFAAREAGLVAQRGGRILDLNSFLCGDETCPVIIGNVLVYRDRHHLTPEFTITLADVLDAHVAAVLALTTPSHPG